MQKPMRDAFATGSLEFGLQEDVKNATD